MFKKISLLTFLCTFSILVPAQNTNSQQPAVAPAKGVVVPEDDKVSALYRETFEKVWRTVKNKHFDPTLGGVDWDKVRVQYEPRLAKIKDDKGLYALLQQMLGELKQSHFNIIPPNTSIGDEKQPSQGGGIGIDIQIIEGQVLITRIEPDSAAARAGLRTGFAITQINDKLVKQVSIKIKKRVAERNESAEMANFVIGRVLSSFIEGKSETPVTIKFLNARNQLSKIKVQRERLKGEMSPPFGNMPAQYLDFESRRLAYGIGYIRFNIWMMSQMPRLRAALKEMSDSAGIIIDLRGNPGGIGLMAPGLAGNLEQKQVSLGTMQLRSGYQNFTVFPQSSVYTGPLVILTDFGSMSTSEIFAAGLQENGRAIVVGERSAGEALPSYLEKLPTGAIFQYAIADFKTPKGVLIEGRGVIPDISVKLTRASLLKGHDVVLDTAIEQIQQKTNKK